MKKEHNSNQRISLNLKLYLIIILFLSIKLFHLFIQKGITWDGAVYIAMGKYIFSLGKIGLWEPARPIIWPLLLGLISKTGLNIIILTRLAELLFSLGCIILTYTITKEVFEEKIATIATLFLALSPTFLLYSSSTLTGIPSTFFALASIYYLINKKYYLTGLFIGLSTMTRFLQLLITIPITITILLQIKNNKHKLKKIIKQIRNLAYGFLTITIPYLILNIRLYKNPIYPFLMQSFMTKYTGWIYHQPFQFYILNLIKENPLILFSIIGIIIIIRQTINKKDIKKTTILGPLIIFFIFFSSIAHKETRFIITFLPYLYMITAYGIIKTLNTLKNKKILYTIMIFLTLIWVISEITQIKIPNYKEYDEFQDYIEKIPQNENIWITNPIFIVNSNKKPEELIYYPIYNSKKIDKLKENIEKANHILIDTCDILPCQAYDEKCNEKNKELFKILKEKLSTSYKEEKYGCKQLIFSS